MNLYNREYVLYSTIRTRLEHSTHYYINSYINRVQYSDSTLIFSKHPFESQSPLSSYVCYPISYDLSVPPLPQSKAAKILCTPYAYRDNQ